MRILFMTMFVASFITSSAQVTDLKYNPETGRIEFQKILEAPGASAPDLFKSSKKWIALTYRNPDYVEQSEIPGEMLRGNGLGDKAIKLAGLVATYGDLAYSFKIDFKEGKLRYTIFNMRAITSAGNWNIEQYIIKGNGEFRTNSQAVNVRESVELHCYDIYLSLQKYILEGDKGDDW